jgi:hypothetical protein
VLTWHQNTMMNVMLGESDDLPYPSIRVVGPGGDGRYGLAVTGTAIGSAGAGPYRGLTRTWVWDPTGLSLVPGPDLALPSTFRIHVLNDADQADLTGDYTTALELYARVVNDDSLQDWVDPAGERANLSAYAMFRQVLTQLQLADSTAAQAAYLALRDVYPPASPGGAYGLLGQAFWTAYQASGSIGLASARRLKLSPRQTRRRSCNRSTSDMQTRHTLRQTSARRRAHKHDQPSSADLALRNPPARPAGSPQELG